MKQTIQKIHQTYKILGDPVYLQEYQHAVAAAISGDDPTYLMSPVAVKIYAQVPSRLNPQTLDPAGRDLRLGLKELTTTLKSSTGKVRAEELIKACDLVVSAALYYKNVRTTETDRMILARSTVDMLVMLVKAIEKREAEIGDANALLYVDSLRTNTQITHVVDETTVEFEDAVDNVIYLRDYIEAKAGEVP